MLLSATVRMRLLPRAVMPAAQMQLCLHWAVHQVLPAAKAHSVKHISAVHERTSLSRSGTQACSRCEGDIRCKRDLHGAGVL